MGGAQSIISENAATVAAAVGAVALVGVASMAKPPTPITEPVASPEPEEKGEKKKKKQQKKKVVSGSSAGTSPATGVVSLPPAIAFPGQFDEASGTDAPSQVEEKPTTTKKPKKKSKAKPSSPAELSTTVVQPPPVVVAAIPVPQSEPEPSTSGPVKKSKKKKAKKPSAAAAQPGSTSLEHSAIFTDRDTDAEWTRVESKKVSKKSTPRTATPTGSTSTGDDEASGKDDGEREDEEEEDTSPKPLAERLLPKPIKTGVEDMLETPDHPTVARVMRVVPASSDKPAEGYSWADYEDVDTASHPEPNITTDDDGWGFVPVKSRNKKSNNAQALTSSTTSLSASTATDASKKKRQNAAKRASEKAAKDAAERERLEILAKHKKTVEQERMKEQVKGKGSKLSGGQVASVDEKGRLVWE